MWQGVRKTLGRFEQSNPRSAFIQAWQTRRFGLDILMGKKRTRSPSNLLQKIRRRLLRFGLVPLVLGIMAAVVFGIWYSQQDEATREAVNEKAIIALQWLRDLRETSRDTDEFIDLLIGIFPEKDGVVINPAALGNDQFAMAGFPVSQGRLRLLENAGYAVGYDEGMRNPAWVAYRLHYRSDGTTAKRAESFEVDPRTVARTTSGDYTDSGFDRGHMAPNHAIGLAHGPEAQWETFRMSNIVPQAPALNQGPWRILEQEIANDWLPKHETLWVITGPVYRPPLQRLASGVAIPTAFFKIIAKVDEANELRVVSVVVPQEADDFATIGRYLTSVDEVESLTGLDFLSLLDDTIEDQLEADQPRRLW